MERSAGKNVRVVARIQKSAISKRTPMLDVPGCEERLSEAKAIPVVSALNTMARVKLELRSSRVPLCHATIK